MRYVCPKCHDLLTPVESLTLYSKHSVCIECRVVYVTDMGVITVCSHPKQHVRQWPELVATIPSIPPPVIAGPLCRGLL